MITTYQTDPMWGPTIKTLKERTAYGDLKVVDWVDGPLGPSRLVLEGGGFRFWVFIDLGKIEVEELKP